MNRLSLSIFSLVLVFLASCATTPPVKAPPVFYPNPPAPPRIQFLTTITGSSDLEPPQSFFSAFISGGKQKIMILDKPFGIAAYQGKIYVCDSNATVFVLDLEKKTFHPMPEAVQGLGKVSQPLNISIDKKGNKYVADPVRSQVVMFDKNDIYVKAFGPIEGWKPVDAAPFDDFLYVVDAKNDDIKIFNISSGLFRNSIGKNGDPASQLSLPTNIAFDSEGYLYVSDPGRFQIVKLDRDGNGRGTIGSLGKIPGSFARPRGVTLDGQNRVYAVDAAFNVVQIFDKSFQLLLYFGGGGKGPGDLILPAKVAIDYDDVKYFQKYADPNFQIEFLILVTNQFGPIRVNIYGFGTEKGQTYTTNEQLLKELNEREEKQQKLEKEKQEKLEKEKQERQEKEKQQKLEPDQQQREKPADADQKKD